MKNSKKASIVEAPAPTEIFAKLERICQQAGEIGGNVKTPIERAGVRLLKIRSEATQRIRRTWLAIRDSREVLGMPPAAQTDAGV